MNKHDDGRLKMAVGRSETGDNCSRAELQFPVPAGEQEFLATLMQFMRSAKQCPDRGVARAARRRETALGFRIRMSLQERRRVPVRRGQGGPTKRRAAL